MDTDMVTATATIMAMDMVTVMAIAASLDNETLKIMLHVLVITMMYRGICALWEMIQSSSINLNNRKKSSVNSTYTFICFAFMIFEFIGGWLSNSVAIMTDAAHMLSDVTGFFISIMSIHLAMKTPTEQKSYGFLRTEVLGALTSIIFIWALVIWLVFEASCRVHDILHHEGYEI